MQAGNSRPPRSEHSSSPYQTEQAGARRSDGGWLEIWYRWTTPAIPSGASFRRRELVRRARLASLILSLAMVLLIATLPISIANHSEFFPLLAALGVCALGLILNRAGLVVITGIMLVVMADLGFISSILGRPNGLDTYTLPLFDLLAITELIAVSILPAWSVFIVAFAHGAFIWAALTYLPHSNEIQHALDTAGYGLIARPIFLQIFVAVIAFLWVRSTIRALVRADQAEEIVALQQTIAQQKQQLEDGVEQIVQMHVQIANGNFNPHIQLPRENALWRIASSLNTVMARLQRLSKTENELRKLHDEIAHLTVLVRQAKSRGSTIQASRSGTGLDPLLQELHEKRVL